MANLTDDAAGLNHSPENYGGVQEKDVPHLRLQFGVNALKSDKTGRFSHILLNVMQEPMFLLLAGACILYFILGQPAEGFTMMAAMAMVTAISIFQEARSTRALKALKQYTSPRVRVIRDSLEREISSEELLPGDIIHLAEGEKVPADAVILKSNDLSLNESVITGESFPVTKNANGNRDVLYQGSTVNSGMCIAEVTATGNATVLGKLGLEVMQYQYPKTLLQQQVRKFIRNLALFGLAGFVMVWLINYLQHGILVAALLSGLTLAMAVLPEEIPVALSSFMALGAYRLAQLGIITRQPNTIENLGAITVICLDKTGTITENRMTVSALYDHKTKRVHDGAEHMTSPPADLLSYAVLSSERQPFDAMEVAIREAYEKSGIDPWADAMVMTYEYPLMGDPPMMTHVYRKGNTSIVASKGGPEKIIEVCGITGPERQELLDIVQRMASEGCRILGVASASYDETDYPQRQEQFNWRFEGLVALYDPPRHDIGPVFDKLRGAGIRIKMLTGDYPHTAVSIARQTGLSKNLSWITGDKIMEMDESQLIDAGNRVDIFARMFPDAKNRLVKALRKSGHIVAMTGDGVNDGPALKSSDIGIAMGKKGTDIARQAADLVLTDDNIHRIVEAVGQGRKIFTNFKKAIRYIISIHIPIILVATLPLVFGWEYTNIFTPVHVIFLELIMGPTCSIFFEREPAEADLLTVPPRSRAAGLFVNNELLISIVQGLVISSGVLGVYYYYMQEHPFEETRTMVFNTMVLSNIFLTFANRSFTRTFLTTIKYRNSLVPWVLALTALFLVAINFIDPLMELFGITEISIGSFSVCALVAFASVAWFEVYKALSVKDSPGRKRNMG